MLLVESELPQQLTPFQAVEAAYTVELAQCRDALVRGLPVLLQCDKQLVPFFYRCLRDRLKAEDRTCIYLDGRPREGEPPGSSLVSRIVGGLADAVRGAVQERIVVMPHLDLLMSTAMGGLSPEGREAVSLLYENPSVVFLGFQDVSLPLPRVIENLFPMKIAIVGVPRDRLQHLITRAESRKFGRSLNTFQLYKLVSGVHAVQLRRILASVDGEDYPTNPSAAWAQVRQATVPSDLSLPDLDLHRDIGGYASVKVQIQTEIVDLVKAHSVATDERTVQRLESLVPRGIIFWGPPGTGKTLFAKAMATALGAAVQIVSGPELKSKWVGESEANLRQVFVQARKSAPCVIVFDEIDAFAAARGTHEGGSGVEHSMVNQLLTEMDGFRRNEMVFVVGTTNFYSVLDPALLRPGRFEFKIEVPFPAADDRRAILEIYDSKLELRLDSEALDYAVDRTGEPVEDTGLPWSGDHLYALCRALARDRLRANATGPSTVADVERALSAHRVAVTLNAAEELVVATHECGHAIVALHCAHVPPIQRISIRADLAGALGFVRLTDPTNRHVTSQAQLRDALCVMMGGHTAERVLLGDVSNGAGADLDRATRLARDMVEALGMTGELPLRSYRAGELADGTLGAIDRAVDTLLGEATRRAEDIVKAHRDELLALRGLLLEQKVLDRTNFPNFLKPAANKETPHG